VNVGLFKALAAKNLSQEIPVNPVVGLLKVKFQENPTQLLGAEFMDNFDESQGAFQQIPPLYEAV
jgi:hypothetical protein